MLLLSSGLLALFANAYGSDECGRHSSKYFDSLNYIIGGRRVGTADSVVSFQVFKSDELWNDHEWKHICGGTLLNKRWILTAAHCLKEAREWGTARVVVGRESLSNDRGQEIRVRRMVEHPNWKNNGSWDMALVELRGDVQLDSNVSPACVNERYDEVEQDESCAVPGWGKLDEYSEMSDDLQMVKVDLMTNAQCTRAYRNMNGVRISNLHVCAGRMGERGKGICQGDLGGPLFCRTQQGIKLVGIATNGAMCGSPQHPGVFVRVDNFISWIRETTKDERIGESTWTTKPTVPWYGTPTLL